MPERMLRGGGPGVGVAGSTEGTTAMLAHEWRGTGAKTSPGGCRASELTLSPPWDSHGHLGGCQGLSGAVRGVGGCPRSE